MSGFLTSWATPAAIRPSESSFSDWISCELRDPELGPVPPNLAEPGQRSCNGDVRGDNKQDDKRAADRQSEVQGQEMKDGDADEFRCRGGATHGPASVVRQQERRYEGKARGQKLLPFSSVSGEKTAALTADAIATSVSASALGGTYWTDTRPISADASTGPNPFWLTSDLVGSSEVHVQARRAYPRVPRRETPYR